MIEFLISNIDDLNEVATTLLNLSNEIKIICFFGDMGSGKTTLIKEICKKAKVTDHVNSPTFSIVNEYYNDENQIIYHFDCYRIENIIQAKEIGFEEYLASENLCLIEWPEKVKELLIPYPTIHVRIEEINNHKRKIQIILPSNEKEK